MGSSVAMRRGDWQPARGFVRVILGRCPVPDDIRDSPRYFGPDEGGDGFCAGDVAH
ncbi:MAG: hypothetical protein AAF718_09495 [Pseudomonadota bacterium]